MTDISSCSVVVKQLSYSHTPTPILLLPSTMTGLSFAASRQDATKHAIPAGVAERLSTMSATLPTLFGCEISPPSARSIFRLRTAEYIEAMPPRTAFLSLPA